MLKWRIATGVVLVAVVLWMIWFGPRWLLPAVFVLVAAIAAWEWARLIGLARSASRALFTTAALAGCGFGWWLIAVEAPLLAIGAVCLVVWIMPAVLVGRYLSGHSVRLPIAVAVPFGVVLLSTAWLATVAPFVMLPAGPLWLTALFLLVWGSDIGGFIVGRLCGRRRLAVAISPAKTWEGAAGGLLLAMIAVVALVTLLDTRLAMPAVSARLQFAVAPLVVGGAIVGDLFESMLKRQAGVKDSSAILPGHGGVLDRIDALLMAAPIYAVFAGLGA